MIKLNWKSRIVLAIVTGILYAGSLSLFDYFSEEKLYSTNALFFQGLFFGLFIGLGLPFLTEKLGSKLIPELGKSIAPDLIENEQIEFEGPANLFTGIEGVGGKLFLTNKQLIFKSHKLNIQTGQTNIHYTEITQIIEIKTGKLVDNGIRVSTKDGKKFDFVVNDRANWMNKINEKVNSFTAT